QFHVLSLGRCDDATASNDDSSQHAAETTQDAANNGADTGPGPNLAGLTPDSLTLNRFRDGCAHRVGSPTDRYLVKGQVKASFAIESARSIRSANDASHDRSGRNERPIAGPQIHDSRCLEPIFGLRRF